MKTFTVSVQSSIAVTGPQFVTETFVTGVRFLRATKIDYIYLSHISLTTSGGAKKTIDEARLVVTSNNNELLATSLAYSSLGASASFGTPYLVMGGQNPAQSMIQMRPGIIIQNDFDELNFSFEAYANYSVADILRGRLSVVFSPNYFKYQIGNVKRQ